MKAKNVFAGIGLATLVGLVIYAVRRGKQHNRMRDQIADQGYETAQDILFPKKNKRGNKAHYGPVLPR